MAEKHNCQWSRRLARRAGVRIGLVALLFGSMVLADTAAWAQRAVGDQVQAADRASTAGDNDKAVDLYSKAIRSGKLAKSDLARTFLRRGRAQAAKGAHARAVADYTNALWLESLSNDDAARALALRGVSRQALKQGKAALGDLAQAVAKAPSLPNIYMNRGVVLAARNQPDKAIADFDKAISLGGGEVYRAYYEKGLVLQATGKRDAARASFSQSLRLRPGFGPAQSKLAQLNGGGAAPVARASAQPSNSTSARSTSLLDNIFGPTGNTPAPQHTPTTVRPSPANPVRITALPQSGAGAVAPANPTRLNAQPGAGVPQPQANTVNNANLLDQILGPDNGAPIQRTVPVQRTAPVQRAAPVQPGAPGNPAAAVRTNRPRQLVAAQPSPAVRSSAPAGAIQPGNKSGLLSQILGAENSTPLPRRKPGDRAAPINAQPLVAQNTAPVRLPQRPQPAPQTSTSLFGRIFGTPEPRQPSPTRIAPVATARANPGGSRWSTQVAAGAAPAPSAPPQPRPRPLDRVAELEWSQTTTIRRAPFIAPVQRSAPVRHAVPVQRAVPASRTRAKRAPTRVASRSTPSSGTFGSEVASATKAVTATVSEWLSGAADAPPPASARKIKRRTAAAKPSRKAKPRRPKVRRAAPARPAKVAVKASEGGYVVQVSAQKSLAAAQGIAKRVSARHGDLFGSAKPYIIKAQVSGKGTFYRVRVGPYRRKQQVASLCRNLQGRGQACFATRTN